MAETHVSASDLKVADLKKELEKRGLSKSGNKAQLIDRLQKGLEKEGLTIDAVFGAQVFAQKSNSAISGSDMARWCSQITKKDSATPTMGQPADGVTSPVTSPTPPTEHLTPQQLPQMIQVSPQINNNGSSPQLPVEIAQTHQPPQLQHLPPPQPQQPPQQMYSEPPASQPIAKQPEQPPVVVVVQQVVEKEPPPVQVMTEPPVVVIAPRPPSPPPQQQQEPTPVRTETTAVNSEPVSDLNTSQPAYSEPLLLDSEQRGTFSSPLSVQEQDRLSDDERDERPVAESRQSKIETEEKKEEQQPESKTPQSTIDPAMLVPRRQLRLPEKRQADTAEQSGDAKRKRKWSEEVNNQPSTKGAIISTEFLKQMNLPEVSDVEEKEVRDAERTATSRRRRFVMGDGDAVESKEQTAASTAEPQQLEGGGDEGDMMDTLELTVEEKGDDFGGDDLGSGGESSAKKMAKPSASSTQQPAGSLSRKASTAASVPVPLEVDEPRRAKRNVSPARSEPTNILHVENLVRPFSLGQLKELLCRVGTVDESLFWTDKVKSHCIVGYKSVEDAVKTREALHGTQWPSTNPKILSVDFVTSEFLDRYKSMEEGSTRLTGANIGGVGIALGARDSRPPRLVKGSSLSSENVVENVTEERSARLIKATVNGGDAAALRRLVKTVDNSSHQDAEPLRDRQVSTSTNEVKRNKEQRRRHSESQQQQQTEEQQEAAKPRVSLDDLFRRTKTLPHLYWLPLTDEEFVRRDNARKEREKEREAREREREREREQREKERARERERELERQREMREQRERDLARSRERDRDRERQSSRQPDRRDYPENRRRQSPDQARGRRPSPEPPRRQPPAIAAPAPAQFREPVTPPPFREQSGSGRQGRSRSRDKSSSRSASRSSSRSSRSSSTGSSRSRSRSSSDSSPDRRRRR